MLVLSRQRDQTIIIGDSIRITIVEVRGDKVRIGIDAPKDVTVHRQEIYDAIKREIGGTDVKEQSVSVTRYDSQTGQLFSWPFLLLAPENSIRHSLAFFHH